MSIKPIRKAEKEALVLERVKNHTFSQKEASNILKLSLRQIKRKIKLYKKLGMEGLIHKNYKRKSNRSISNTIKMEILNFLNKLKESIGLYAPTYALEKLEENTNYSVSCETLRKIMIENGLWKGRKRKDKRKYWRQRKLCVGQMIQLDGSKHMWFNDQYYTLLVYVDDATSKIMHAEFCKEETVKSLSKATILYLKKHGAPISMYVDRGKVFKVNNGKQKSITQYHRMLTELDIELIFAYSPQAKGRVERLFRTLQDRLVKELKLRNIQTIEQANYFLSEYIGDYNSRFSISPQDSADLHRPISDFKLESIFCIKNKRILADDSTICYKNRFFLILKKQAVPIAKHANIAIYEHFDGTVSLYFGNHRLKWLEIYKRDPYERKKQEKIISNKYHKPPQNHPWRQYSSIDRLDIRKR